MHNPTFDWPAVSALLTLIVSVWMIRYRPAVQPPIPFKQPMIAFEFATSAEAIKHLFIDPLTGKPLIAYIHKMRDLNRIDFLYIGCYTAFSFTFAQQANLAYPSTGSRLALIVAFVPGLCDVLEDIQLLNILNLVEQQQVTDYQPELTRLSLFTWIKWLTIPWLLILLFPFFWHNGFPSKLLVLVAILVAVAGLISLLNRRQVPIPIIYVSLLFLISALVSTYALVKCFIMHFAPSSHWL